MNRNNAERARAWGRYWATGVRHSCPGSFTDHYGESTRAFWREQFDRLKATDTVLELGCGNGSLIRLLGSTQRTAPLRVHAVDLAQIDRKWLEDLGEDLRSRIELHPNTSAAAMPIADAAITRVYSQFALEYFVSQEVWSELDRVMAPGVQIAVIAHRRGSRPWTVARAEHAHCDWLLQPGGALDQAQRILPLLAAVRTGQRAAAATEAERARFNATFAALAERAARLGFGDILHETAEAVMRILGGAPADVEAAARLLADLRRRIEDNRLRVAELVEHALDERAAADWAQRLRQSRFSDVELGELSESGYLFGWRLWARRS
ncbi:MAG: class I SAM-dependent methyltransferase [Pseudomonadota bacterium]